MFLLMNKNIHNSTLKTCIHGPMAADHYNCWCELTLIFLLKQLEANISPAYLPVLVVDILRINTTEQNIKAVEEVT